MEPLIGRYFQNFIQYKDRILNNLKQSENLFPTNAKYYEHVQQFYAVAGNHPYIIIIAHYL